MKPTKQQIEAALAYEDGKEDQDSLNTLKIAKYTGEHWSDVSCRILAAAYRKAKKENERLKKRLKQPSEIICTKCGLREERGEKPKSDF